MKKPLTDRQKRARKKQNCELGKIHRDCGQASVRTIGSARIRVCQRHLELILAIKADADVAAGHRHPTEMEDAA